jgi:hypothetical protein
MPSTAASELKSSSVSTQLLVSTRTNHVAAAICE